jgi:hypothetical protein|nr:MAG TPA: ERF superfamily protein [Caudoviricetes sp.]
MANGMKKLLNIAAKLEVGKNRKNTFGKYAFRNAEDILTGLKPLMVEYGVFISIDDDVELIGDRYYIKSTVSAYDAETGDLIKECHAFARESLAKKGMDDGQLTGATSSYARKYALAGLFNLSPMKDLDETHTSEEKPSIDVETHHSLNETHAREEKPTMEMEAHHSIEEMINLAYQKGIDGRAFAKVLYGKNLKDLSQDDIDNAVNRFYEKGGALEYYLGHCDNVAKEVIEAESEARNG